VFAFLDLICEDLGLFGDQVLWFNPFCFGDLGGVIGHVVFQKRKELLFEGGICRGKVAQEDEGTASLPDSDKAGSVYIRLQGIRSSHRTASPS
jgi:hypothetical protein